MNVHHLELFYFVAKFGGIAEAVRNMPYGIQQPAISGQILQLEAFLGVTLFHRRPFSLTPAGAELYEYVAPFFGNLDAMATKLQGGTANQIRIGASEVVLRDHMPDIAATVRKKFPHLKLSLREGYQPQLEGWLERQELDLCVTLLGNKPTAGIKSLPLLDLSLALLVEKNSKLKSAQELWDADKIEHQLISLPGNETISRHFQQGLARKGIDWFPSIEVSTLNLIETYVARGYGIGLTLVLPKSKLPPEVRVLPLPDFSPVTLGVIWHGKPTPLAQAFIDEMQGRVRLVKG